MENRFGIKDFFLFAVVLLLIVLVVVAMFLFNHQFQRVQATYGETQKLAGDLNNLSKQLARMEETVDDVQAQVEAGVRVTGTVSGQNGEVAPPVTASFTRGAGRDGAEDPFYQIEEAQNSTGFARGGWLLDNFGTKIGRLTPLVSSDIYQTWLEYQVMEPLASRDPFTLEWMPKIARDWKISDDGLEITVRLKKNVRFSDGEPLDADDVIFTYDWILNPDVQADRVRSYLEFFDRVEKIDDFMVKFYFTEPYFKNFEYAVGISIMAEHYYSQFSPTQYNEAVGLLFGSGPYMIDGGSGNWSPGNGVTLIRNPRYWGTPSTFDRIRFEEIESEDTEAIRFRNQEQDRFLASPELYLKLTGDPEVMEFAQDQKHLSPYKGYTYIGWNQIKNDEDTFFADKRVRQAMTMLLDRDQMNREIFEGLYSVASGPFDPNGPQSDPNISPLPFDVDEAKALLKEAGFEDRDNDGIVENADGEPFQFTLTYPGGSPIYEKIVLFIRDNLKRGGIDMRTERTDWPVLIRKLNAKDFDAIILGWSSVPESDPNQVFHSSQIEGTGDNRISYRNAELDSIITEARKTMDTDARMEMWNDVHRILHEDQPYTFLFNRPNLMLFNKRIQNIESSKVGLNFEYLNGGTIPWYIQEGAQRHSR